MQLQKNYPNITLFLKKYLLDLLINLLHYLR